MFTLTPPPDGYVGWFNYFEIGKNMKYDFERCMAIIGTLIETPDLYKNISDMKIDIDYDMNKDGVFFIPVGLIYNNMLLKNGTCRSNGEHYDPVIREPRNIFHFGYYFSSFLLFSLWTDSNKIKHQNNNRKITNCHAKPCSRICCSCSIQK